MLDCNKNTWYSWVNLIYGAYYKYNERLLRYLYDHLDKDQLNRYYKFSGPRFADVDNRLMSLQLVKTE
jgi:hypothetical protein